MRLCNRTKSFRKSGSAPANGVNAPVRQVSKKQKRCNETIAGTSGGSYALDSWFGTVRGGNAGRHFYYGNDGGAAKKDERADAQSFWIVCPEHSRIHEVLHGELRLSQSVFLHRWTRPSRDLSADRSQHVSGNDSGRQGSPGRLLTRRNFVSGREIDSRFAAKKGTEGGGRPSRGNQGTHLQYGRSQWRAAGIAFLSSRVVAENCDGRPEVSAVT